jgi:HNH endonuclease
VTKSRNLISKRWHPTPSEQQFVREHFATMQTGIMAAALGVNYHQVCKLAKRLGLHKSESFYASPDSGRLNGTQGAAARFQPGHTPANKGKKCPTAGLATRFTPGRKPEEAHNYKPIGSTKVSHDGYLIKKITDDQALVPARRWEAVHRLVWIAANGPIPRGHVIAFKPGMHTTTESDITLDKLELVSRQEWIQRHTYHQYGPEVAELVRLRGAITRQINKRLKAEEPHEQKPQ